MGDKVLAIISNLLQEIKANPGSPESTLATRKLQEAMFWWEEHKKSMQLKVQASQVGIT
jgi:hypothetical protein